MSRRLAKSTFALALITGAIALAVAPVSAEVSVTVAPALVTVDGDAGGGGTVSISITNGGDEAFTLDTAVAVFQDMDGHWSAVDWTAVRPKHMRLEPGRSGSATIRITIPDDVASGGRYAAITFTTARAPVEEQVASIAGRVTVPILLAVRGEGRLTRDPVVERFAPFIETDGRLGFRAQVRNDGNVHARVAGSVHVGPPGEEAIASLEIPDRIILPETSRVITTFGTLPLLSQDRLDAMASFSPPSGSERTEFEAVVTAVEFDPRPELALGSAGVCENLDRGPSIQLILDNRGGIGLLPAVRFEILDAGGALVGSATPAEQPLAWPGELVTTSADLSQRLLSGSYTLRSTASFAPGSTLEATTPFSIGGDPATAAPLCPAAVPDQVVPDQGAAGEESSLEERT